MSQTAQPTSPERVVLGLLASLGGVVLGVALTVLVSRAGFISGITSLVIAFGCAYLYSLAAGRSASRGLVPLVIVIVLGVVLSFLGVVASNLVDLHALLYPPGTAGPTTFEFVQDNLFDPDTLSDYGRDLAFFAAFAALGIFGTVRRLVASR